jgi:hypothetical protein
MSRSGEYGRGLLKAILWLLLLAVFVYACVKIIPYYVNNYELEDFMKSEARFAAVNRRTPEEVRQNVWTKIQELEIPATRDSIKVSAVGNNVTITVSYTVVVNLLGYQLTLKFQPTANNRSV